VIDSRDRAADLVAGADGPRHGPPLVNDRLHECGWLGGELVAQAWTCTRRSILQAPCQRGRYNIHPRHIDESSSKDALSWITVM
jgi:hypothetical protein